MSECSNQVSKPAAVEPECLNSKPAVEPAVAIETKTNSKEHSVASTVMAAPILAAAYVPANQALAAIGAADVVIDKVLSPVITKFAEFFGKIKSLEDVSYIETNLKLKQNITKKANEDALTILLKNYEKENIGVTDVTKLAANLEKLQKQIDEILNLDAKPSKQGGGKKIISRTHKSINQFLNPKITAANIKSKRKRNTKSGYKSKKRTRY